MSMLEQMKSRAENANNGLKKLNEETTNDILKSNSIKNNSDDNIDTANNGVVQKIDENQKREVINSYIQEIQRKQEKKRLNVSLSQDTFEKLITIAGGKSVSAVIESIVNIYTKDTEINKEIVEKYCKTMENKKRKKD